MPAEHFNAGDDLLRANLAGARGERTAYIDDAGRYSYRELAARANAFATQLRELGVQPRSRVLLCLEDGIDFPVCFLGALRYGAVPVALSTLLTTSDYEYIATDSDAVLAVISASLHSAWAPVLAQRALPVLWSAAAQVANEQREPSLAAELHAAAAADEIATASTRRDDVAFWLYTSGTTGKPKGVMHAHGSMAFTAASYGRDVLGLHEDDVVYSAAKLFFAYGLGNSLTFPLAVGATTILSAARPQPAGLTALFARHRPTVFCAVPTLYAMLLSADALPHSDRLRRCISAGEALPEVLLARWRARTGIEILDGIGSTEMLHIFISNRAGAVTPGSSGVPVPGYTARILTEDGVPVADEEVGDLEVRGASAALGYWKLPELSAHTFRNGWVRTGDKYLRRANGALVYCGRRDDMLKVGGIYVSPMEVENALLAHPQVLEAAVVGARDADDLVKPKAYVVLRDPTQASEQLADDLIRHVRTTLAEFKRPRWVSFVTALPKTPTGKVQRFALRADNDSGAARTAPDG